MMLGKFDLHVQNMEQDPTFHKIPFAIKSALANCHATNREILQRIETGEDFLDKIQKHRK